MPIPFNNVVSDLINGGLQNNAITQGLSALGILPPTWGVFGRNGQVIITADTVISLDFRKDWTVADYPLESGAFTSYDKVENPSEARIGFWSGGSLANRQALLRSIKTVAGDFNLYDIVTPEETFTNMNITHYDYRRVDGAAGYVSAVVWLQQIRVTVEASVSASEPNGASTVNDGQVQPQTPEPAQESLLHSWFGSKQQGSFAEGTAPI